MERWGSACDTRERGGGVGTIYDMYLSLQDQESPLMWALHNGNMDLVKLLLNKGAEVNMQDVVSEVQSSWILVGDRESQPNEGDTANSLMYHMLKYM